MVLNTNRNTATVDSKEESLTVRVSNLYHSPYLFVLIILSSQFT